MTVKEISWGAAMARPKRILLIGGTEEAVTLNHKLADIGEISLITSLAGRTTTPATLKGHVASGGFGGRQGLVGFLIEHEISLVIDATHPFADQMTQAAFEVCMQLNIDYLRFQRPSWEMEFGDRWIEAKDVKDAASKLSKFERIFLSIGRQELAAFDGIADKYFLVRSIEAVDFAPAGSNVDFIQDRGPFTLDDEVRLMSFHKIDLLVSKNSGGDATYAKIAAARHLKIPVLMIHRPQLPDCRSYGTVEAVLSVIGKVV